MLKDNIDPNLERTLQLQRARPYQINEQKAITKLKSRVTVSDLFIRWCETDLINRKDIDEVVRMFNKDVLPALNHGLLNRSSFDKFRTNGQALMVINSHF
jgi:hypothetical protein